jgi:hypothetical protein
MAKKNTKLSAEKLLEICLLFYGVNKIGILFKELVAASRNPTMSKKLLWKDGFDLENPSES